MSKICTTLLSLVALAGWAGSAIAADSAADTPQPKAKPYTLTTCIVSGDKLGTMGDPVVVFREGREIKFCCKGCTKDFDKDPAKFLKQIEEFELKATADAKLKKNAKSAKAEHQP